MQIEIEKIIIEDRLRQNTGNLESLMDSMRRHGQLNPITLTVDNHLIAGFRRIASAKRLGWKTIEAIKLDQVGEIDLIEMEIEENLCRRALTEQEINEGLAKIERLKHPPLLTKVRRFFARIWKKLFH